MVWVGAMNCLILLTMALLPKVQDMLGAQMVGFSRVNVRVSVMIRVRFSFSGMNLCQLEPPPPIPLTYIRVRAVVWECGEGQIDTQAAVKAIVHFASDPPHTRCNNLWHQPTPSDSPCIHNVTM